MEWQLVNVEREVVCVVGEKMRSGLAAPYFQNMDAWY